MVSSVGRPAGRRGRADARARRARSPESGRLSANTTRMVQILRGVRDPAARRVSAWLGLYDGIVDLAPGQPEFGRDECYRLFSGTARLLGRGDFRRGVPRVAGAPVPRGRGAGNHQGDLAKDAMGCPPLQFLQAAAPDLLVRLGQFAADCRAPAWAERG